MNTSPKMNVSGDTDNTELGLYPDLGNEQSIDTEVSSSQSNVVSNVSFWQT